MLSREIQNGNRPRTEAFLWAAILVAAVAMALCIKPRGDFLLHIEFGRRLMHGEFLYANGMHTPYPPFWAMLFAPFSLLPLRVALPLFFAVGFSSLIVLVRVVLQLALPHFPAEKKQRTLVVAAVLLVLVRFVQRDLVDGGENLLIIALTWTGIWFFARRKPLPGGALLGLAIALKCTPLLFCGYFFLKRQWVAAFSTLAFATAFSLSPALVEGPQLYATHIKFWKNNLVAGLSQKDPSVGVLGPDELHNKALKPMLARFLMRLPEGHPGRFPGAAHIDFFRFAPQTAGTIIKIITLLSGLVFVWLFSRSPRDFGNAALLWECAIISVLMLLFSPITWGQHCVATIPAALLIGLRIRTGRPAVRWILWSLGIVAAAFIFLNRSIIGFTFSQLLESYHTVTFCLIALVAVLLAFWGEAEQTPPQPNTGASGTLP
jgi:alpha-1,2-mannosyltransferase